MYFCISHLPRALALSGCLAVWLCCYLSGRLPAQVSFKKKESERATAARKSSYAYKKSIEDAEPWVALKVHGQNDEPSLDEFARMFVDHEDFSKQGTKAKEFPAPERYLQGLDYMEEYDENGESFSAGSRGR